MINLVTNAKLNYIRCQLNVQISYISIFKTCNTYAIGKIATKLWKYAGFQRVPWHSWLDPALLLTHIMESVAKIFLV
jgi:hypothetical protein